MGVGDSGRSFAGNTQRYAQDQHVQYPAIPAPNSSPQPSAPPYYSQASSTQHETYYQPPADAEATPEAPQQRQLAARPYYYNTSYAHHGPLLPEAAGPPRSHASDHPLCSECNYRGPPVIRKEAGFVTWFSATMLCWGGCFPFCFLPFCSDCLADTVYRCSNCGSALARRHA